MWIYEQTKPEENLSLLPQTVSLPVQKAEPALPTVPATAPVLSGSVARAVCTGQYARDGTAF